MNLQSSITTDTAWHAQAGAHAAALIALQDAPASQTQMRGMQAPAAGPLPALGRRPVAVEARQDVPIDEISFSALRTMAEINSIKYLRGELNLPGSVLADPEFERLEKKETSTAWSVLLPVATH